MRRLMNTKTALVLVVGLLGGFALFRFWDSPHAPASPQAGQIPVPARAEAASEAKANASSQAVAFIDLESVYNKCKQTKAFDLEIDRFRKDASQRLEHDQNDIRKQEEQSKNRDKAAPDWAKLETEYRARMQEYNTAAAPVWLDLNQRTLKTRKRIYTLIRDCTARVAKEKGVAMVLADIEEPDYVLAGTSADDYDKALRDYSMKMHRKQVLYAAPGTDLTQTVLDAVNAEPGS